MKAQSGFDIKVIVNELEALNGSRINKFYNTSEGELLVKFYSSKFGKKTLRVLRGECIHLTGFKREVVDNPSHFTMLMRKYMNGAVLKAVEQPFFERVIFFRIERGGEDFNIVIELFNKGNIIVCNNNMVIINSLRFVEMKGRVIRPGEKYELPLPNFQELYLDQIEFRRTLKSSDKDSLVKCLAVDIGLGGKYAEELCALSGIDKMKNPSMLNKKESDKIFEVFFLIYKSIKHYKNIRPCVILKTGKAVDFAPFPLKSYEGYDFEMFETFNEACDYYYSRSQKEDYESQAKNVYDDKIKNRD